MVTRPFRQRDPVGLATKRTSNAVLGRGAVDSEQGEVEPSRMKAENSEVFRKVVVWLSRSTAVNTKLTPITLETEVYYDLGLYGDDLYELVMRLYREFGVGPELRLAEYGPREWPFHRCRRIIRKLLSRSEPQYTSLKVRDIVAAIEARGWPNTEPRDGDDPN